jgi:hypothetical protein
MTIYLNILLILIQKQIYSCMLHNIYKKLLVKIQSIVIWFEISIFEKNNMNIDIIQL